MNIQKRQISKTPLWFTTFGLILGIYCNTPSTFAQTGPPLAMKNDVWSLNYNVRVEGDFSKEPEIGTDQPTVYYHIKREYTGKAELRFDPRTDDLPNSAARFPAFKAPSTQLHVTIHDFWNTLFDPVCDEYQSIEEYWDADAYDFDADFPTLLLINNEKLTYKTSFPILFTDNDQFNRIEYKKLNIYTKAGGVREIKSTVKERLPFTTHQYPNVRGFIKVASIIRAPNWSELKVDEAGNRYHYISDVLHPDEPLIEGISDSKDKVNIIIYYSFTRVKG